MTDGQHRGTVHERFRRAAGPAFVGIGAAVIAIFLAMPRGDGQTLVYNVLAASAAVAILVGARLHRTARPTAWHLLAAGVGLWVVGDIAWGIEDALFGPPDVPCPADIAYLAAYPIVVLAVARMVRERLPGRDVASILDATAATVAAAVPAWVLLMSPITADSGLSFAGKLVSIAYPLADLFVLAVLVRLLLAPARRPLAYWLLVAGMATMLVADTLWAVPSIAESYTGGGYIDGLYLFSYVLLGASALHPSMVELSAPTTAAATTSDRLRIVIVGAASLTAPVLLATEAIGGNVHHVPVVLLGWCVVLGVVLTRLANVLRQLSHKAQIDPLTSLANRSLLLERIDALLHRRGGVPDDVALLYLDLDHFKLINDTVGHEAGDHLLVDVAERLRTAVRPGDLVARLGGDEFVVLCEEVHGDADARALADRLATALADPFWIAGSTHILSASIGISRVTSADHNGARLLRDADTAMYRAKVGGKARAELFDPSMHRELSLRKGFEHDLAASVEREELALHYHPVVALADDGVVGVEALLRWEHPDWGTARPDAILAVARASGLTVAIGRWVVGEACRQLARWERANPQTAPREVTVNVSRLELVDAGFVHHLERCLERTGVAASRLLFDVNDAELAEAPAALLEALVRVRQLGARVCIDQFGDGRRSLTNMRLTSCDRVKLDRALVARLGEDERDVAVVGAIIGLGAALGIDVAAAGVETPAQRDRLLELGCGVAQGHLWGPPLPPGSVLDDVLARVSA